MTASAPPAREPAGKRKRPFGVNAIIVLSMLSVVYSIGVMIVLYLDAMSALPALANLKFERWLMVYLVATAVVQVAIVIGLWRLERWGWFLVMLHTGFGMFLNIWAYFNLQPNYLAMVASVLIVFYMNQREVQQAFMDDGASEPPAVTTSTSRRVTGAWKRPAP